MSYGEDALSKVQEHIAEIKDKSADSVEEAGKCDGTKSDQNVNSMLPNCSNSNDLQHNEGIDGSLHEVALQSLKRLADSGQLKVVTKTEPAPSTRLSEAAAKSHSQHMEYAVPHVHYMDNEELHHLRRLLVKYYSGPFNSLPLYSRACDSTGPRISLDKCWVNLQFQTVHGLRSTDHIGVIRSALKQNMPVVLSGVAGVGKSTLLKKIALDWANGLLPEYDVVLVARLREISDNWMSLISMVCSYICKQIPLSNSAHNIQKIIEENIKNNDLKVLIMLDGLDEIQCTRLPMYLKKHSGELLPFDLILTTRTNKELEASYNHVLVWIVGFDTNESIEFVDQFYQMRLCDDVVVQQNRDIKKLLLSNYSTVLNVAKIPLLLSMACESGITKGSLTALYSKFVSLMLSRYYSKKSSKGTQINDSNESKWQKRAVFSKLGYLAFGGLIVNDGIYQFNSDALHHCGFNKKTLEKCLQIGILENCTTRSNECYEFVHATFQEFLAAFYIEETVYEKHNELQCSSKDFWTCRNLRISAHRMSVFQFLIGFATASSKSLLCESLLSAVADCASISRIASLYHIRTLLPEVERKIWKQNVLSIAENIFQDMNRMYAFHIQLDIMKPLVENELLYKTGELCVLKKFGRNKLWVFLEFPNCCHTWHNDRLYKNVSYIEGKEEFKNSFFLSYKGCYSQLITLIERAHLQKKIKCLGVDLNICTCKFSRSEQHNKTFFTRNLSLRFETIDNQLIQDVNQLLTNMICMKSLDIIGTFQVNKDVIAILEHINCYLGILYLRSVHITLEDVALLENLMHQPKSSVSKIKLVGLVRCDIDAAAVRQLFSVLGSSRTLMQLALVSAVQITQQDPSTLAYLLQQFHGNSVILFLTLSDCGINDQIANVIVEQALMKYRFPSLIELNLSWNLMSMSKAKELLDLSEDMNYYISTDAEKKGRYKYGTPEVMIRYGLS